MGITKGKGFAGALGSMRDMQHEYVPLPYKEMMTGNLIRQASYDTSQATLDEIGTLYDETFIEKDAELLDAQETELNTSIEEMIQGAGGDLGKLTGAFTNLYRKTASNKTYRNAKAQKANRTAFSEELRKAKLDQGMAQYYLGKADDAYVGADKGQYNGVGYSTIKQSDIRKEMLSLAKAVPATKRVATLNGFMYNNAFHTDEELLQNGIDGVALGLTPASRNDKATQRDSAAINQMLEYSLGSNPQWMQSMSDFASANGMDPEEYMKGATSSAAIYRHQNDYEEGKPYAPIGYSAEGKNEGLDLQVPGNTVVVDTSHLLTGSDENGQTLEGLTFAGKIFNLEESRLNKTIGDSEYYADKSVLSSAKLIAEESLGFPITEEDLESVRSSSTSGSGMTSSYGASVPGMSGVSSNVKPDPVAEAADKRRRDIKYALKDALEEVTARSTFTPSYTMTSNMEKGQKEVLAEFKTAIAMFPEAFMQIKGVDSRDGEGYLEPSDDILKGNLEDVTITGVSDRPILNSKTGKLEYRVTGQYPTKRRNRQVTESKMVQANFNGVVPISDTQRQVWSRLGIKPLTKTKADLARLTITGQVATSDSLMKISESKSLKGGKPIMYGVVLAKQRSGKDNYAIVEIDPISGLPNTGEDGEYNYFTTPQGSAVFNTLDAVSMYIDKTHQGLTRK